MSDSEEKFLSWKVSATTKAELERVLAQMKAQRGGRKVTQDEVTLALLARHGSPALQNDALKCSHVKSASSDSQMNDKSGTTGATDEAMAEVVSMFEVLRGDIRKLARKVTRDAGGSEEGGVGGTVEPGASAEASVPVRSGREPL